MKKTLILVVLLVSSLFNVFSQTTIFEDDFESYNVGDNLTTKGYDLTKKSDYSGNVTATITDETGNKIRERTNYL